MLDTTPLILKIEKILQMLRKIVFRFHTKIQFYPKSLLKLQIAIRKSDITRPAHTYFAI